MRLHPIVVAAVVLSACDSAAPDDAGMSDDLSLPGAARDAGIDLRPAATPDLAAADLAGADLASADLAAADLATPDLAAVDLAAVDLAEVDALTWKQRCFPGIGNMGPTPDYDKWKPIYAEGHCNGTNMQDIRGVQKVVFLGDSVTVGSPPNDPNKFYRSVLAEGLAAKWNLDKGNPFDWLSWKNPDLINGVTSRKSSGAFWSCSKWGARMDDLIGVGGNDQIAQCFGGKPEPQKTLIVMTMGGNDLNKFAQYGMEGKDIAFIKAEVDKAIAYLDQVLAYVRDPKNFPNGAYVALANVYEFTDGSGDLKACPAAGVVGYSTQWPGGAETFVYFNEQIVGTAVKYKADAVFMMENFCGHGFKRGDVQGVCYRGPNTPLWFDLTCIHPNNDGHVALAGLFKSVIDE